MDITRRGFLGTAAPAALSLGSTRTPIRARVLEHPDKWTDGCTGVARFLEMQGVERAALDVTQSPLDGDPPDLIAFGSFTNNAEPYQTFVGRYKRELRSFVERGGVVLEMTQSDQFGDVVEYLPTGMRAARGDRDLDEVHVITPDHPLTRWVGRASADADHFGFEHPNWESMEEWEGMQVLLASSADGRTPCLLEAAHGRGRFVVSSLYIDKCFRVDGSKGASDLAIERSGTFFRAVVEYVGLVREGRAPTPVPTPMPSDPPVGPLIGHVDTSRARVLFRPPEPHLGVRDWACELDSGSGTNRRVAARTDADRDFTVLFDFEGLDPATKYDVRVHAGSLSYRASFRTDDPDGPIVLGMGSCAPSEPDPVWTRVLIEGCDGFVMLGDTPYVDTNVLSVARQKHRNFLVQPEISRVVSQMPIWGTWDDHDFGLNDGHGDFPGKHICRLAFTEYRANASFGHDSRGELQTDRFGTGRGIYTSFTRGPLEVFLLDPRWFSRTEPSWADPTKPTCLGREQWEWLKTSLVESDRPFKLLTTGMIWDDKENGESDDWHTYRHERDAIFDFIREKRIEGCVLIGGDIHVSRALKYPGRVGYDLWQFIVSPLHGRTIPSLNVPHPNLVHDAVEPHVFLRLACDGERLEARWINRDGRVIFEVGLSRSDLSF